MAGATGAKETPRQKMIGMMYLVLTALLALNVSNSVLDKFVLINRSLEASVLEKKGLNTATLERINKAVSDAGNRPKDMQVLTKAKTLREQTEKSIAELEEYKNEFVVSTGGKDETGDYIGKKNIERVSSIMVRDGKGELFKKQLNGYNEALRGVMYDVKKIWAKGEPAEVQKEMNAYQKQLEKEYHNIAQDAREIEGFKDDPDQSRKTFAELQFGFNTPMVGALASVSQMQTEILNQESRALDEIARYVGAGDIKFDQILAMVRPESQTVASGATYRAEMFVAASSSGVTPIMYLNNKEIPVVDGKGKVEFKAFSKSFDQNGLSEQSYTASIKVKLPTGGDTTFINPQTYYVAKPVIQIQSASVQALYLKCGNELSILVPSLGVNYKPSFGVRGGEVIKGNKPGLITIVPNSKEVTLTVNNAGTFIGDKKFKVRRIPKPEIQVYVAGRAVGPRPIAAPRSMNIKAVPDESFKTFLPKDARFRVTAATVTLVRSARGISSLRANDPKVNTSQLAAQARTGDNIVIEIKKVVRKNFRGQVEQFNNFSPAYLTIQIK